MLVRLVAGRELREHGLTRAYLIVGVAVPAVIAVLVLSGVFAYGEELSEELLGLRTSSGDVEQGESEWSLVVAVVAFPLALAGSFASGQMAGGVIEEKSSRVIEVLLATMRPHQLLVGKMLGIGLLALLPVALVTVTGVLAVLATELHDLLPGLTVGSLPLLVLWFLLGYSFFIVISAALASLASRPGENFWQMFSILLLVAGFQAGVTVATDPRSAFAIVTSYVPFTAPFVVPTRVLAGGIAVWAHLLAAMLMVVAMAVMSRVAARVYAGALLRLQGRTRIGDAYRSVDFD